MYTPVWVGLEWPIWGLWVCSNIVKEDPISALSIGQLLMMLVPKIKQNAPKQKMVYKLLINQNQILIKGENMLPVPVK